MVSIALEVTLMKSNQRFDDIVLNDTSINSSTLHIHVKVIHIENKIQ